MIPSLPVPPKYAKMFFLLYGLCGKQESLSFFLRLTLFVFLGVKVEKLPDGLYVHQHFHVDELLRKHVGSYGTRVRGTTAARESFTHTTQNHEPQPPDPNNPQHRAQIKRAQQIIGALLRLSTSTRPDLSYAMSMAASVQTRDLKELDVRLCHLLQYLGSHPHKGLHYKHPTSTYRSLETCTGASSAPCGAHLHQGFAIKLQVGYTKHLLHWSSTRQKLVAQSSAEAELIALMTGYKATKNFQHLFHESFSNLTPILRCDNQAVLAMLDKPSWRSRHISIRGEALRQAKEEREVLITFVSSTHQAADPLTKPTPPQTSARAYAKWSFGSKEITTMAPQRTNITTEDRQPPRCQSLRLRSLGASL